MFKTEYLGKLSKPSMKIQFPVEQKDISNTIKQINEEIRRLSKELQTLKVTLKAIQECCLHSNKKFYSDCRDPSGESTECEDCGKEWL